MNNKLQFSPVSAGAVAIGMLAVSFSTSAAAEVISVNGLHQSVNAGGSLSVNLNNDQSNDFTINNNFSSTTRGVTVDGEGEKGLFFQNKAGTPVPYGTLIDSTTQLSNSVALSAGNNLYVPVSFQAGNHTDFGWLNLSISSANQSLPYSVVLNGYGYETTGTAVKAGVAVPEPSSLLLLAGGMVGLAAYRRRRSS